MHAFEKHRAEAPKELKIGVITVSTSRYLKVKTGADRVEDESGWKAMELIRQHGHGLTSKKIVDDDIEMIRSEIMRILNEDHADVVILTGGTGISPRDVTIEAVAPLLTKTLEGFGEIFRMISYQKIGAPAFFTRALGGLIGERIVFCLPGSPHAVETALGLILSELPHLAYVAKKK